ncbi:hypothetical protein FRC02_004624 [Tulasnella sp. 418]|nr:hypothetical protein FRC02_004624 [Tulasnella sp. 418]
MLPRFLARFASQEYFSPKDQSPSPSSSSSFTAPIPNTSNSDMTHEPATQSETSTKPVVEDGLPPVVPVITAGDLRLGLQHPMTGTKTENRDNVTNSDRNENVSEYDFYRLGLLGEELLAFVVTSYLLEAEPQENADSVRERKNRLLRVPVLSYWASLCCLTEHTTSPHVTSAEAKAELLRSYVGAVYHQDGMRAVQLWIGGLVRYSNEKAQGQTKTRLELAYPDEETAITVSTSVSSSQSSSMDTPAIPLDLPSPSGAKRKRSRSPTPNLQRKRVLYTNEQEYIPIPVDPPTSPWNSRSSGALNPLSQPSTANVPVDGGNVSLNTRDLMLGSSKPTTTVISPNLVAGGMKYLSHLNQIATQRRMKVVWQFGSSGPPHLMEWFVNLMLDGKIVSLGKGATKQAAKEDAARKACVELGWYQ